MCGRFYVGGDFRDKLNEMMRSAGIIPAESPYLADLAGIKELSAGQDVFPSNGSLVICSAGSLSTGSFGTGGSVGDAREDNGRLVAANMKWGFANPYKKGLIINARAETVRDKNLFADGIRNHRCIIPASGFYEWDAYKARFRFTVPGGKLLLLAGIFHEEQGEPHYTILTTEANDSMKPVHDRMPVMIAQEEIDSWINDNNKLADFLERPQVMLEREQDAGQIRMDFGI